MNNETIPFIEEYEEYLTLEKRLSENTIGSYLGDIANFFEFSPFDSKGGGLDKKAQPLKKYLKSLEGLGIAPRTINRKLSSLKGFFEYLVSEEEISNNPLTAIRTPKIQKYKPDFLDYHEMDSIYKSIDIEKKGGKRDLCLIELLYGCGLRISEAIGLPMDKIHTDEGLLLIQGKGNKQRLVPMGKKVQASLFSFIKYERPLMSTHCNTLLCNRRGGSLSRMGAWKIVQKIVAGTDIKKKIYPHTFRHTYASHLIDAGADLRAVQELLGHSDISTTQIYTHLNQDYLFEVHTSYHPRNQ